MNTLYHYCSVAAFHAIIHNRSLWLSSLSMSNDGLEGRLVSDALSRLGTKDGLSEDQLERLRREVQQIEEGYDGLGLCLSESGDLLSQWRGYGSDAFGVSIGFNRSYLERLIRKNASEPHFRHLALERVVYEPVQQEELLTEFYQTIRQRFEEESKSTTYYRNAAKTNVQDELGDMSWVEETMDSSYWKLWHIIPSLYLLKPQHFVAEAEWRIHTICTRGVPGNCSYRPLSDRLIPYVKLDLSEQADAIDRVILGSKHAGSVETARTFLSSSGFKSVEVTRSEISYR